MQFFLFSFYDDAVKAFTPPFAARSEQEAIRNFQSVLRDDRHPMAQFPQHYSLFVIGMFDDANAQVAMHTAPVLVGTAMSYMETPPKRD